MTHLPSVLLPYSASIEASREPTIEVEVLDEDAVGAQSSRLGGLPWWPASEPYPLDAQGEPLWLLAQINFAETPALAPFPREGILQIFIGPDGSYGCNFDDPRKPSGFRSVFHRDLSQEALVDYPALNEDYAEALVLAEPLRARALSFKLGSMTVPPTDYRFQQMLPRIAKNESLVEAYADLFDDVAAIRLGGYPTFVQSDPRQADPTLGDFCLMTVDVTDGVMFGDGGAAQFLADEVKLAAGDFAGAVYQWDCC